MPCADEEGGIMNNNAKVVVLQSDEQDADDCARQLSEAFEVLCATADEAVAYDAIAVDKPEFLVTSLTLKSSDGIEAIERVRKISPRTLAVVISSIGSGPIVNAATDAGAAYYMVKPINYRLLIKRMLALCEEKKEEKPIDKSIDEKISRIFLGIGIPPQNRGYSYLREGIKIVTQDPSIIGCITKKLYPMIAERFNTDASKVERAIRHAIEVAWNKGKFEVFNSLFGVNAYTQYDKPTNSEFIALIADRLLLDGFGKDNW